MLTCLTYFYLSLSFSRFLYSLLISIPCSLSLCFFTSLFLFTGERESESTITHMKNTFEPTNPTLKKKTKKIFHRLTTPLFFHYFLPSSSYSSSPFPTSRDKLFDNKSQFPEYILVIQSCTYNFFIHIITETTTIIKQQK